MNKIFLNPYQPRLFCECCEFPTIGVPIFAPGKADYRSALLDCPLCEWDNPAVDVKGEIIPGGLENGAERNGGHPLAEAQSNFRRFLSMYDPATPEPWMPDPPSHEELQWKEELVRQYKQFLDPYCVDATGAVTRILGLESALSNAAQLREEDAEAAVPIDDSDDADSDDDGQEFGA